MQQIVNVIGPTFFVVALGYLFGRLSRSSVVPLVDMALYIAVPCLAFSSMFSSDIVIDEALKIWASCLLGMAGTFAMARLVFGLARQKHSGLYLPISIANVINLPLPIIYLAFGDAGAAKAVLYYIPNGLVMYSLGVYVAAGQAGLKQGLRTMLRTPLIYAAVLGVVLNLAGVVLPTVITTSIKFVGQAGVPLMLIILGMSIGRIRVTQLPTTLVASVIRMGGGFALGLLSIWLLGLTGLPRAVVLFESAMPAAVVSSILCMKYKNEAELAASVVLVTTLLSVVVVPALLYYLT